MGIGDWGLGDMRAFSRRRCRYRRLFMLLVSGAMYTVSGVPGSTLQMLESFSVEMFRREVLRTGFVGGIGR